MGKIQAMTGNTAAYTGAALCRSGFDRGISDHTAVIRRRGIGRPCI